MQLFTESFRRNRVVVLWLITSTIGFVFAGFVCRLAFLDGVAEASSVSLVFFAIVVVLCCIQGLLVLLSPVHCTSTQYGFFIGHTSVMCTWMIGKMVAPEEDTIDVRRGLLNNSTSETISALAISLWLLNLTTCVLLITDSDEVVGISNEDTEENEVKNIDTKYNDPIQIIGSAKSPKGVIL